MPHAAPSRTARTRPRRCAGIARALLLTVLLLGSGCTSVFLQPDRRDHGGSGVAATAAESVWIDAPDGSRLHALWLPAAAAPRAAILFLHGNAENLSSHIRAVDWLPAAGYAVLALDYRGYGRSEGHASIDHVHEDAAAALRWLAARAPALPLVVLGQSLGATIAINLVADADADTRARIGAVIADSGFSGYRRIAREKLAELWLTWPLQVPLSWLVSDAYAPIDRVARIAPIPLLLIHGARDAVVPPAHGERLHERAGEPKALWRIEDGRHIDALGRPAWRARLLDYLAVTLAARGALTARPPERVGISTMVACSKSSGSSATCASTITRR